MTTKEVTEKVYPSRIDWWIGLLIFGVPFIHIPLGVWVMLIGSTLVGVLLIFWGLIVAMIIAALSFPCHYCLGESKLTIRSGMIADPIPYSKIESVRASRSMAASPALSLDRLRLDLKDGTHRIISPRLKQEFVEELETHITLD